MRQRQSGGGPDRPAVPGTDEARAPTVGFDWDLGTNVIRRCTDPDTGEHFGPARESGAEFLARVHPDDRPELEAALGWLSPSRPTYRVRYRAGTADSPERVFEEHGMGHFADDGTGLRVIGITADVTEECVRARARDVSERALGQRLELLAGIMDRIPAMILVYGPDLRDLRVNSEFERLLGWSNQDLQVLDMLEACCPDPVQRQAAREWLTASDGGWRDIAMVAQDGSIIDVAWASAELSEDLRVGVGIDVRARKRMELALRHGEERLRHHLAEIEGVYANAPVGLCVLDRDLRFQRVNARLAEMNGIPASAHIGRTLYEVAPDLAAQLSPYAARLLEHGEPVLDLEIQAETAARPGERRTWLESWLPIKDARGNVTGVNVVARELTEQRRAENRLAESEARFRTMAETVPDILFTSDADGHASYVNQRFYRITGMLPGSALGMAWLEALHPDDRDSVTAAWAENAVRPKGFSMRYRLRDREGNYRWFQTSARPIFDDCGRLVKWFGAASDVDELVQARQALEEADRQKNEFLAILGHELRNPMAPVRSAVDVMEAIAPNDPKLRWAIAVVDRQSRHMGRLLDDLLDVSRIIRGKLRLDKRVVALDEIIEHAVDGARHLIDERGHRLDIELPDDAVFIDADASRLEQVLVNLLTNSAKYTPDGGHIRLLAEARTGVAIIRVIDNGQGISEELREGLFDAFTQGRRELNRSPGGLGLGLAIAARLAELHGGRIEMYSDGEDAGSEFTLFLPRAEPPERRTAAHRPAPPDRGAPLKILVVDDNEDVARSMGVLLTLLGCEVEVCLSGAEALETAATFAPRLVLLDIGMEGMDGFETARRLRQAEPDPGRMLLVAVSGYGDPVFKARGRRAGFDQHLTKPVGRDRLTALLNEIATGTADL